MTKAKKVAKAEISELSEMDVDEVDLVHGAANGYSTVLAKSAEDQVLDQVEKSLTALFGPGRVERVNTAAECQSWLEKARETNDASLKAAYLLLAEGEEDAD